ncbi:hypothetical protein [Sphingomonas sp. 3-13AW]|jgi:hypothetical protein|uniref:hypothetical protein n=1 Tax=Sphingomonas sp. 3-13AW TaxID=3050450 RepID=UPI003BB4B816
MKRIALAATVACALAPQCAWAQDGRVSLDGELSYGLDVVPPDVVDTSPDQDRIRSVFDGEIGVNYDIGPAIVRASGGFRIFPSNSDYNRYPLAIGARFDLPLSSDGRTKLRLLPSYEYVFGNHGRVFDRPRLDAQLIHRHNAEHTTTVRLRYGHRNQTERRFSGYDQSEWLGEIRHFWRPNNGPTRINASLLGLHANAEANRFSYNGYGTLLTARTDIREDLQAYGRLYLVHRDYKAPFSSLYPYKRKDTQLRLTGGLEKRLNERFSLFGEAGYARNNSNVPTRRYDGFVGRIGIILR